MCWADSGYVNEQPWVVYGHNLAEIQVARMQWEGL